MASRMIAGGVLAGVHRAAAHDDSGERPRPPRHPGKGRASPRPDCASCLSCNVEVTGYTRREAGRIHRSAKFMCSSGLWPHHLKRGPIAVQGAVWIEIRVVAHDVLIRTVEPGVVILVAELERGAGRRIAEGLHAAR